MEMDDSDIEQNFLTAFSCLGTTDKDDLIKQFQQIGDNLHQTTAQFFLEMNNWNLQEAVGCYFDFMATSRLPSMAYVQDITVGKGENIPANTPFENSFLVQNDGDARWPDGCYLKMVQAPENTINRTNYYYVPSLQPNDTTIITVNLISPSDIGTFTTKWRLCTANGTYFGATIWAVVEVIEGGTLAVTQDLNKTLQQPTIGPQNSSEMECITNVVQQQHPNSPSSTTLMDDSDMW